MTESKRDRRIQHMVPDPDRVIEHGSQPTVYVPPPKPPTQPKNGGIGNINTKKS